MGFIDESDLAPDPSATPVAEMIGAESSGNPKAVSPKGARGLMQIMPANAKAAGIAPDKLFDPSTNVALGSKLYQQNLKLFNGDRRKAAAAYNWGPGNVKMHPNEADWPKETQAYVNKIEGPLKPKADEVPKGGHYVSEDDLAPDTGPPQQFGESDRAYQARQAAAAFEQQRATGGQTVPQGTPTPEQEALQAPPLADPVSVVAKHPYITAGVVGALTPPGWAVDALGVAGAVPVGIAEQEAYMGMADLGMKIAGPNHPYVGLAIGALGPALGGGAMSMATGVGRAVNEARAAAGQAEKDFWEAAQKGATEQEAKNIKERAEAAEKVAKEAKARHEAIKKAYGEQASKNLKTTVEVYDPAIAKLQAYADHLKNFAEQVEKHGPAAEDIARKKVAPEIAAVQRATTLGRTPAETAAATTPTRVQAGGVAVPSPEQLERTRNFRQSFFNVRQRLFGKGAEPGHYGQQYQDFENKYGNLNVDNQPALRDTLDKWKHVLDEQKPSGEPPSAIKKLMDNAGALSGKAGTDSFEAGRIEMVLAGRSTPGVQSRFTKLVDDYAREHGQSVSREQMHNFAIEALGGTPTKSATVTALRALRRDALRFADSASNPRDARIANEIAASAAKDYEHAAGLPETEVAKLHNLNEQYAHDISAWSPDATKTVMDDREPANVVGTLIKDPDLMDSFASNATDVEKGNMRNALADWANINHYSIAQVAQKVGQNAMEKLGFNLPRKAWMEMEPKDIQLNEILRSDPMAQHAVGNAFADEMKSYEARTNGTLRRNGIKIAEDMGELGKPLADAMRNAVTPEQVRQVAQKIAAMNPKEVAAQFAKGLQTPQSAAYEKYLEIAQQGRPAREAFQRQVAEAPGKTATAAAAAPEKAGVLTRPEAARKAMMEAKPGKFEDRMRQWSTFRLMFSTEMIAGMAVLTGRVPPYWLAGGVLGGAMKVPLLIRGATRAALSNPAVADFVWRAVENPHNYRVVGKSAALALQALAEQHAREQMKPPQGEDDNQ